MGVKCRVCLATTDAKMYHSITTVFPEYMKTSLTVLDLLQIVTSTNINMPAGFPDSICTACLKELKDSYNFIEKFKTSQSWLYEYFTEEPAPCQESIIVKVEAVNEMFSSPTILDMDGTNFYIKKEIETYDDGSKISFLDEITDDYTDVKLKDLKNAVQKPKVKKLIKMTKKAEPKKKIVRRPINRNEDGLIVMSIEDVLIEDNKQTNTYEYAENRNNPAEENSEDLVTDEDTDQNHSDIKESDRLNSDLCVMSIEDVVGSASKLKSGMGSVKRKRTKGILTQSTDLVKNLGRKMRKKRIRRQEVKDEGQTCICDICQKVYPSQRRLKSHKYTVHVTGWEDKFKCTICGLRCKTRSSHSHHMKTHNGKHEKCDECDKVYLTSTQLKEHKTRIHGSGVPAKFLCNECGKRFKFNAGLKYHLASKHNVGEKQYMCRYCGFTCFQKSYISRHERCHTGERPYKCKFCDKTFKGTAELLPHQMAHEGRFRYKCQYCGKGFLQTWNLKIHWLQHKGNYGCALCNRSFIDDKVLKFHHFHHHKNRDEGKEASEDTNSNDEQEKQQNSNPVYFELLADEDSFSSQDEIFFRN